MATFRWSHGRADGARPVIDNAGQARAILEALGYRIRRLEQDVYPFVVDHPDRPGAGGRFWTVEEALRCLRLWGRLW
jgi:hypothetical protein